VDHLRWTPLAPPPRPANRRRPGSITAGGGDDLGPPLAVGVGVFAGGFPADPVPRRARHWAGACIAAASVTAWGLFVLQLIGSGAFGAITGARLRMLLAVFDRQAPQSMYWPVLFVLTVPAVAFLVARYRSETAERRRKVAWFLGALAVGFAPLIVPRSSTNSRSFAVPKPRETAQRAPPCITSSSSVDVRRMSPPSPTPAGIARKSSLASASMRGAIAAKVRLVRRQKMPQASALRSMSSA